MNVQERETSEKSGGLSTTSIIPVSEGLGSDSFRAQLHALAEASGNFRAFVQTPHWCVHKVSAGERIQLAVRQNAAGELIGVTPLQTMTCPLPFDIGKRRIWQKSLRGLLLMGNIPLLPACEQAYHELFSTIHDTPESYDCLCLWGVPTDSYLFHYITTSRAIAESYIYYTPFGIPRYHWLALPSTFAEYLSKFSAKTRNTLKRKVKRLSSHGDGSLELCRIEASEQIPAFVEAALSIARNSWQLLFLNLPLTHPVDHARSLRELADGGLLRCYLLKCGGRPCAFVVGSQLGSTFTFYETAYDSSFAEHSAGQVLVYLMIEDLIDHNRPVTLFFGTGDEDYKELFGNSIGTEVNIILIKRTTANWVWWKLHQIYRRGINAVNWLIRRQ